MLFLYLTRCMRCAEIHSFFSSEKNGLKTQFNGKILLSSVQLQFVALHGCHVDSIDLCYSELALARPSKLLAMPEPYFEREELSHCCGATVLFHLRTENKPRNF